MTAIVTGQGLGLVNTSAGLGSGLGQLGSASQGAAGDKVVVDAANGNLVVQHQDEWLVGMGPDVNVMRTYNSLDSATVSAGNTNVKNNWRLGFSRMVQVPNVANPASVVRVAEDGSTTTYKYDSNRLLFVGHEGFSTDDTLQLVGTQWVWTQGETNRQEIYTSSGLVNGVNNFQLTTVKDANGHVLTLNYLSGSNLINTIKTDNNETVTIEYDGTAANNIKDVLTTYTESGVQKKLTRVSYTYDNNRLSTVKVYLGTPSSTAGNVMSPYSGNGNTYTTKYTYIDTISTQLKSITQDDGSALEFTYYDITPWVGRIKTVTDTKAGSTTRFDYSTSGNIGTTKVTNANTNVTTLTYDTVTGQLQSVAQPTVNLVTPTTSYKYDTKGNVTKVVDARGGMAVYRYDANSNLIYEQNADGEVITRTYTDATSNTKPNLLQTLTVYKSVAALSDGVTSPLPPLTDAQTTRYVYDTSANLRFEVSAEGRVTEYQYFSTGLLQSKTRYAKDLYPVDTLAATATSPTKTLSLAQMVAWQTSTTKPVDKSQAEVTTYTYDGRGALMSEQSYLALKADGSVDTAVANLTNYVSYIYDQAGNLLQSVDGLGKKTTYAYDGLNRIAWQTDGANNTTSIAYAAAGMNSATGAVNTVTTVDAMGLRTVQNYDRSGHLQSVARISDANPSISYGSTNYVYDALGHLVQSTDATSQSSYFIYDADGRKVGEISPNRELTEYIYNANGQLTQTIAYAQQVPASALSGAAASLTLASVKSVAAGWVATAVADDRRVLRIYDAAGRLAATVDAVGSVVSYRYDGRGELVQRKASSTVLSSANLSALQSAVTAGANILSTDTRLKAISSAVNVDDRTEYRIFSPDGLLIGEIDGRNYLTKNTYNASGQLIQRTRYANVLSFLDIVDLAGNTLPAVLKPTDPLPSSGAYLRADAANDQTTFYFYNAAGQLDSTVDAENYLTKYTYDKAGRLLTEARFADPVTGAISSALDAKTSAPVVVAQSSDAGTRPYVLTTSVKHTMRYTYDGEARIKSKSETGLGISLLTTYDYNAAGQVIASKVRDVLPPGDERRTDARYDEMGRMTAQLSAEGNGALAAMSAPSSADIENIWKWYGTQFAYDNAGRKTSATDASGNKTLYFYDADGRVKQTVNALGEVTGYDYTAFGDVKSVRQYGTRLSAEVLGAMQAQGGGLNTATFSAKIGTQTWVLSLTDILNGRKDGFGIVVVPALTDDKNDSVVSTDYTRRGEIKSVARKATSTDTAPQSDIYSYTAFGQLKTDYRPFGDGDYDRQSKKYDQSGNLTSVSEDSYAIGGSPTRDVLVQSFDAFGRVTGAQNVVTKAWSAYSYDRLGRQLTTKDALGATTDTSTYDAFGRMKSTKDAQGNTTTYAYDPTTGIITIKHGQGSPNEVTTTRQLSAFGQVIKITDGRNTSTKYVYNLDGLLTETVIADAAGQVVQGSSTQLNKAGLIQQATDAQGVSTIFAYDQANRVLTKTVDATPATPVSGVTYLNLTTKYVYDAKGQAIWVQDANGVWTHTEYDLRGDVTSVTVDPALVPSVSGALVATTSATPLNLKTTYEYDSRGHTVRVTEGVDAANTTAKVTQYTYDAAGRRTSESVDPLGLNLQTEYTYDDNDNVVAKTVHNSPKNEVTRYVYDGNNRLMYSVDATGAVVRTDYDGDGRVTRTIAYVTKYTGDATKLVLSAADLTAFGATPAAGDERTINVYNQLGQLTFTLDARGYVTQRSYDGSGNLSKLTRFANKFVGVTLLATQNRSAVSFAAPALWDVAATSGGVRPTNRFIIVDSRLDQTTQFVYDGANRLTWTLQSDYSLDAYGRKVTKTYVTQQVYDIRGNLTQTRRYNNPLGGSFVAGLAPKPLSAAPTGVVSGSYVLTSALDQVIDRIYDAANRMTFEVDAERYVTQVEYDALGHVRHTTRLAKKLSGTFVAGQVPTVVASAADDESRDARTDFDYDAAGRLTVTTDAEGNLSQRIYDAANRLTDVTRSAADGTQASTTHYVYDTAGRLADEIAGYNAGVGSSDYANTRYELDGLGNRIKVIDPRGVELAESDSEWAKETRKALGGYNDSSGKPLIASALSATQKADLRKRYTTSQEFDALGQRTRVTDPLGGITQTAYDAFGNAIETIDARGQSTYAFYNTLNQKTWQVDALGFATRTIYDGLGQVTEIDKFALPVQQFDKLPKGGSDTGFLSPEQVDLYITSGLDLRADLAYVQWAPPGSTLNDPKTLIEHDLLGRQVKITDALQNTESMRYDALGNKVSLTNKLGGTYAYVYDRNGNLTQETLPVKVKQYGDAGQVLSSDNSVINTYVYDARGNRTKSTEALKRQEQRVTTYTYDRLNRQLTKTGELATFFSVALNSDRLDGSNIVPSEARKYDSRGNLIEVSTAVGFTASFDVRTTRTLSYYDALDRKIADINALGIVTRYRYNEGGDVVSQTIYSTPIDPVALDKLTPGGVPPEVASKGDDRTRLFSYDANHRLLTTTIQNIEVGEISADTGNFEVRVQDLVTRKSYDAVGNVMVETDARGNTTWHYYDALGQQIAQIDAERYLTTWAYDAGGHVVKQAAYAGQVPMYVDLNDGVARNGVKPSNGSFSTWVDALALQAKDNKRRETSFTLDKMGRVLSQTIYGVNASAVNEQGGLTENATPDATTLFEYNALGSVTKRTEATGEVLDWQFDAMGRETEALGSEFVGYALGSQGQPNTTTKQRQTTDTEYNALGLQVRSIERGNNPSDEADDRITFMKYGTNGWLDQQTDAVGNSTKFYYDAAGRITLKTQLRQQVGSSGTGNENTAVAPDAVATASKFDALKTDFTSYSYDAVGRQARQIIYTFAGASFLGPNEGQVTQDMRVEYNAFGEITKKRTTGVLTSANDVNWQEFTTYDNAGRAIVTNTDSGVTKGYVFDANGNSTLSIEPTGDASLAGLSIDNMLAQPGVYFVASRYDQRNLLLETRQTRIDAATGEKATAQLAETTLAGNAKATVSVPTAGSSSAKNYILNLNINDVQYFAGIAPISATQTHIEMNTDLQPPRIVWQGYLNIPDTSIFGDGNIVVDITKKYGGETENSISYYLPSTATTSSVFGAIFIAVPKETYVTLCKVSKITPAGVVEIGRLSISGVRSASSSQTAKQILIKNQPIAASKYIFAFKDRTASSAGWIVMSAANYALNGNMIPGWAGFSADGIPTGEFDFQFFALSDSGETLNKFTGTLNTAVNPPQITQDAARTIRPSAIQEESGKINLLNLTASASAQIQTRTHTPSAIGTWSVKQPLAAGAFGVNNAVGGFSFNPTVSPFNLMAANGPFDYLITFDNGQTALGSFQIGDAKSVSDGAPVMVANLPTTVHFQNLSTSGTIASLRYRTPSNGNIAAGPWSPVSGANAAVLNQVSPGSYDWDAMALAPDRAQSYAFEYELIVTDSVGRVINWLTGQVTVGAVPNSGAPTDMMPAGNKITYIPGLVTPYPSGSIKVYTRLRGSGSLYIPVMGSFVATQSTKSSQMAFVFDAKDLVPAYGARSYDLYYDLFDGAQTRVWSSMDMSAPMVLRSAQPDAGATGRAVVLGFANPAQVTSQTQNYDAFGDVITQTDAKGNVSNFEYNALGKLKVKNDAAVSYTAENGGKPILPLQSSTTYYYDAQGRNLGIMDALGNKNLQTWTAEGADGQSQLFQAFAADGGRKSMAYDRFGDMRLQTDLVGWTRANGTTVVQGMQLPGGGNSVETTYTYDFNHRLVKVDHAKRAPVGTGSSQWLTNLYYYDAVGNRIQHATRSSGAGGALLSNETTKFDALGRVLLSVSAANRSTTYSYTWDASVGGAIKDVKGGWKKTTTNNIQATDWTKPELGPMPAPPSNLPQSLVDVTDAFGHAMSHTDLGQRTFTYAYNAAGWLTDQKSVQSGQDIHYDYYADGRVADIIDNAQHTQTQYGYDANGNKTYEGYATQTNGYWNFYQQSTMAYDAQNRLKSVKDAQYSLDYEYDAVGNRRRVTSVPTGPNQKKQDLWYTYDKMNRVTLTMAELWDPIKQAKVTNTDGAGNYVIRLGGKADDNPSVALEYDLMGNRVQATYGKTGQTERYAYTADGYLQDTYVAAATSPSASRMVDLMGRVTEYKEYSADGVWKLTQTYEYGKDGKVKSSTSDNADKANVGRGNTTNFMAGDGTLLKAVTNTTTTNSDNKETATTSTTKYTYAWWDSALQATINMSTSTSTSTSGNSSFTYDVNGHSNSVVDSVGKRNLRYINNAQGLIMRRDEIGKGSAGENTVNVYENYFYVDGQRVGEAGNDGGTSQVDYASALADTGHVDRKTAYSRLRPITSNFDTNYQAIGAGYPGFSSTRYVVSSSSETLTSVASSVWGDGSLWYLIAEANGLSSNTALTAGQGLVIPNKVTNVHNNSTTHAVYDPSAAMGDTSPTLSDPPPPPKHKGSWFKRLLAVAVAVAAVYFTGGLLAGPIGTMLAGAIAGAVGSVASQTVLRMTGEQKDGFHWNQVKAGAITGAIGGAINGVPDFSGGVTPGSLSFSLPGNSVFTAVARAAATNFLSQEALRFTGVQRDGFHGLQILSASLSAAAGNLTSQGIASNDFTSGWNSTVASLTRSTLTGVASGWGAAMGSHHKPQWDAIAVQSFGSALGDAVVQSIKDSDSVKAPKKTFAQDVADRKAALNPYGWSRPPSADDGSSMPVNSVKYGDLDVPVGLARDLGLVRSDVDGEVNSMSPTAGAKGAVERNAGITLGRSGQSSEAYEPILNSVAPKSGRVPSDILDKAQLQLASGDRGGAYLTLYKELGNEQLLIQAQITTYTGIWGSGALTGNALAKQEAGPSRYNLTLDQFSYDIDQGTIDAIRSDIKAGGTGRLTDDQFQRADRGVWASKGMKDLFPGNSQFVDFVAGNHPVFEGAEASFSGGTWNAIKIGARSLTPESGFFASLLGTSRDGRDVANLVGKRPAEFANDPNYTTYGGGKDRFVTVIDNRTGFVEAFYDRNPRIGVMPLRQLPNVPLAKDSLAYQQRQTFYNYLGANMHNRQKP